jgi:pimeloyl-ACP methyl ester carboxylesterase
MGGDPWIDIVARANAAASQPVLFIPGQAGALAWDGWVEVFETAGYAALTPPWSSVAVADPTPPMIGDLVRRFSDIAQALNSRPAIIGHGLGGLITQVLAGEGVSAVAVAIAPLPDPGLAQARATSVRRSALMIMAGDQDQIVPFAVARAAFDHQRRSSDAVSEFTAFAGRGHTLTTDPGWLEVAETALRFVQRFV